MRLVDLLDSPAVLGGVLKLFATVGFDDLVVVDADADGFCSRDVVTFCEMFDEVHLRLGDFDSNRVWEWYTHDKYYTINL